MEEQQVVEAQKQLKLILGEVAYLRKGYSGHHTMQTSLENIEISAHKVLEVILFAKCDRIAKEINNG